MRRPTYSVRCARVACEATSCSTTRRPRRSLTRRRAKLLLLMRHSASSVFLAFLPSLRLFASFALSITLADHANEPPICGQRLAIWAIGLAIWAIKLAIWAIRLATWAMRLANRAMRLAIWAMRLAVWAMRLAICGRRLAKNGAKPAPAWHVNAAGATPSPFSCLHPPPPPRSPPNSAPPRPLHLRCTQKNRHRR